MLQGKVAWHDHFIVKIYASDTAAALCRLEGPARRVPQEAHPHALLTMMTRELLGQGSVLCHVDPQMTNTGHMPTWLFLHRHICRCMDAVV